MKRSKRALGQARMRVAVGMFVGILIVVGALQASVVGERLNYSALDATQRLVRALAPRPALENIVIVGIDKGTERSFPEPFALWHRHLGEALSAIARGQPKARSVPISRTRSETLINMVLRTPIAPTISAASEITQMKASM